MGMITNKNVKMTKNDDASLTQLIEKVSVDDTIDDDAKFLIKKCFTKGENFTLKNLK